MDTPKIVKGLSTQDILEELAKLETPLRGEIEGVTIEEYRRRVNCGRKRARTVLDGMVNQGVMEIVVRRSRKQGHEIEVYIPCEIGDNQQKPAPK
jgi:hypothetical protein